MTPAGVGRPSLDSQIQALAKRLLGGPIKLDDTTDVEDRVLNRMEQLDLVDLGATTARLTEKGKALAGGGGTVAPIAAAETRKRRASRLAIDADTSAIIWADPPERSFGNKTCWFDPFVPILTAKPNKWARVLVLGAPNEASKTASSLRSRFKTTKQQFDAVARRLPDGSGAVFARFVGKK